MSGRVIISHAHCMDGFTAAWVLRREGDDVIFAKYGDPLPGGLDGHDVIIVDFSWPRAVLDDLHARAKSLLVLDHHATARDDLAGAPYAVFDMERSGAMMALDHVTSPGWMDEGTLPELDRTWLVKYVQDRDLWQHSLPWTREINAVIRVTPRTWEAWDSLAERIHVRPTSVVTQGEAILMAEASFVAAEIPRAVLMLIEGERVISKGTAGIAPEVRERFVGRGVAVNGSPQHASDVCHALLKAHPTFDFACCWHMEPDGLLKYSLRAPEGGFNVAELARCYGGGGHVPAAGFTVAAGTPGITFSALSDW